MATPGHPEPTDGPDDLAALRREVDSEREQRQALEIENARLVAQIESYAEDLGSLYQERHGRGRGGLSAELSKLRAELSDEAARGQVVDDLYKKSVLEASSLTDQLVSYGRDLARVRRAAKKGVAAARPLTRVERIGSIALLVGMLGTTAVGLVLAPRDAGSAVATPSSFAAGTASPSPSPGVRVVSSDTDVDAAIATALKSDGSASAWATVTALAGRAAAADARQPSDDRPATTVGAPEPSVTSVPSPTGVASGWLATATVLSARARDALATASSAQATATTAEGQLRQAEQGGAAAQGTVTVISGQVASANATASAARTAAATSAAAASTAIGNATASARTPTVATGTPVPTPSVALAPTAGPDLRPTVTVLAGTVEQVSARATIQASTATVFARGASAVARTATVFALTATAPTATPTAGSARPIGPPKQLDDLERCSWEVPIPPLNPRTGYFVEFEQANRASVTVLWSAPGAMALFAAPESVGGRVVAEAVQGDIVADDLPPSRYRLRLENTGAERTEPTMVALFYDEMAICAEPTGFPDPTPPLANSSTPQNIPAPIETTGPPYVNCHPYVRAPYGFFQIQPRVWIDRRRRVEGTWPLQFTLTGPGVKLAFDVVAGPGRPPERIPLTQFGQYKLETQAIGVELDPNCNYAFIYDRTDPALPILPAPSE